MSSGSAQSQAQTQSQSHAQSEREHAERMQRVSEQISMFRNQQGGENGAPQSVEQTFIGANGKPVTFFPTVLPQDVLAAYRERTPVITKDDETVCMNDESTRWLALTHMKDSCNKVSLNIGNEIKAIEQGVIPLMSALKGNEMHLRTFTTDEMRVLGPPGKVRLVTTSRKPGTCNKKHMENALAHFVMQHKETIEKTTNVTPEFCKEFAESATQFSFDAMPTVTKLELKRTYTGTNRNKKGTKRKSNSTFMAIDTDANFSLAGAAGSSAGASSSATTSGGAQAS